MMVQLLFTSRPNIGSRIIRAVTWSDWSHVQIGVCGEDVLYGASFPHGVTKNSLSKSIITADKALLVTLPVQNIKNLLFFAESQIGKPYDSLGVIGLGIHRDWQDTSSWWCSEFVAACIEAGGTKLFREGSIHRVTPQHLYMLPFDMQVIK